MRLPGEGIGEEAGRAPSTSLAHRRCDALLRNERAHLKLQSVYPAFRASNRSPRYQSVPTQGVFEPDGGGTSHDESLRSSGAASPRTRAAKPRTIGVSSAQGARTQSANELAAPNAAQSGHCTGAQRLLRREPAWLTAVSSTTEEVTYVSEREAEPQQGGCSLAVQRLPSGTSMISVVGDVDGQLRSLLHRLVADELARQPAQLMLELSGATAADDAGVEALIDASALAAENDISFCLVVYPDGPVVRALAVAGLLERFELFTTLSEAQRQR